MFIEVEKNKLINTRNIKKIDIKTNESGFHFIKYKYEYMESIVVYTDTDMFLVKDVDIMNNIMVAIGQTNWMLLQVKYEDFKIHINEGYKYFTYEKQLSRYKIKIAFKIIADEKHMFIFFPIDTSVIVLDGVCLDKFDMVKNVNELIDKINILLQQLRIYGN